MIGRDLFHELVSKEFKRRYEASHFYNSSDWEEAWQEVVDDVYNHICDDKSLTHDEKEEIGLFYSEAMDMEENVRCCTNCGKPMIEGYYLDGEYACCDECALALYAGDKTQMEEDLSHAEEDDCETYWTDWDNNYFYD